MKTIILLISLMFSLSSAMAQVKNTHISWTSYDARTKELIIKTREQIIHDKNGNPIKHIYFNHVDDKPRKIIERKYNIYNQLLYVKQSLIDADSFYTETTFSYLNDTINEPSRMLKINSLGRIVFLIKTEFSPSLKPIKKVTMDFNDTSKISEYFEYTYNEKDLLTKELYYFNEKLDNIKTYHYDDKNRMKEIIDDHLNDLSQIIKIEYKDSLEIHTEFNIDSGKKLLAWRQVYDKKKNLLKEEGFDGSGKMTNRIIYKYEDNRLKQILSYERGKLARKKEYSYKFS